MPTKKIKIKNKYFPSITGNKGALKYYKVSKNAYDQRIIRGWDKVKAITTPLNTKVGAKRTDGLKIRFNGKTYKSNISAARELGINYSTFMHRKYRGKNKKKIISKKKLIKKSRTKNQILNDTIKDLKLYEKKKFIKKTDDWYKVRLDDIAIIIAYYNKKIKGKKISAYKFLCEFYPKKNFLPWLFSGHGLKMPDGTWEKKETRIKYIKWLLKKCNIKDLYNLKSKHFHKNYGGNLIDPQTKSKRKKLSIVDLLEETYPRVKLKFWLFENTPHKIWSLKKYQRVYLKWFQKEKKIKKASDWYNIEIQDLKKLYARSLTRYLKTILQVSKFCYPKFNFLAWKFKKIERGYFNQRSHILEYINWIEKVVGIKKKEDWYSYGYDNIETNYGTSLLQKFSHSPLKILKYCYPNYNWKDENFGKNSKFEKQLYLMVKKLLNNKRIIYRYKSKICRFKKSNRPMEIDIYIPHNKIGIEFQGSQHYFEKWGKHHLKDIKNRDKEKKKTFKKNGIKILEVNYKWKGNKEPIVNLLRNNGLL
tara:strand:+ start:328 stop:1926 length:1599 start_codon:yes stop_codon:yes gene_type:complete